jgi:hypothetical protein
MLLNTEELKAYELEDIKVIKVKQARHENF